ncbi:MAG TPA: hypothetical protein VHV08_13335, partial [Pirellulales bacterium]|nr:hypothetical protein [Pirellulales bacterium]
MPVTRQIAGFWATVRKKWQITPVYRPREELVPQLYLCQLEERRVLTVGAAIGVALPGTASVLELAGASTAGSSHANAAGHDDIAKFAAAASSAAKPAATAKPTVATADSQPGSKLTAAASPAEADVPLLTLALNQTVNEGTNLSITNIGQFTEPSQSDANYSYSIDWGDGTAVTGGSPTLNESGTPEVVASGLPTMTSGSFDGQHIYADNGIYTVTVTVSDGLGGMTSGTFDVTVNNVAPTLQVVGNQNATAGSPLTLPTVGTFSDPGFNNPLNIGGETSETFSYAIDWGDGTTVDSGLPNSANGGPNVLT